MKKTTRILGTLVILTVLMALGLPAPAAADGEVPVTINAPDEAESGTTFTAYVDIGEVFELNTAQYDIWYDPLVLQLNSIGHGQIGTEMMVAMPNKIADGHWMVVQYPLIMTDNVSGSGYLSVLNFEAIGDPGTSSDIDITDGILSGINEEIPATWTGDTVIIPALEPPTITTGVATAVTTDSAILNGNLADMGEYTSLNLSFVWGPDSQTDPTNYPYEITATPDSLTTPGDFSAALSSLNSNTPYYYRAKATGSVSVYGDEEEFTTLKIAPTVATQAATDITTSNATLNMSYDFGDYGSGFVQFVYGKSGGTWNQTGWVAMSGVGTYSYDLTGLDSNSVYEFEGQLRYDSIEIGGGTKTFPTDKAIPTVNTDAATNIDTDSAYLNMTFDFKDYGSGDVRFAYKKNSEGTWTYTNWVGQSGSDSYGETVSSLSSDTLYDFKAQLKYDSTEIEGAEEQFTTAKAPPGVTTETATDINTDNATLNGYLNSTGDYTTINVSFVWGPDSETDPADYPYEIAATPDSLTEPGAFSAALSSLDSNTPYYYRAKATGSVTVYGDEQSFTTQKVIPTVTTGSATNITTDSADLNMTFDFEDYGSGEVRFAYKQDSEGIWSYTDWEAKAGADSYAETVSGLTSNTLYDFKAQLRYDTTEIEGNVVQFIAGKILPVVTTGSATNITTSNATLNMTFDFKDYGSGDVRFAYKQDSEGTWSYTDWVAKSGADSYMEPLGSLSSNTPYTFKAQLKYDTTEIQGAEEHFTTLKVPPVVTTSAATDITTQSATLHGNLDSTGDYTTINVSFVWGPDPQVDPADYPYEITATPDSLTTPGAFSAPLSDLDSDSPYYYRAKATGSVTVYGDEESFTTEKVIPTVTTDAATDITTSNATLNMTYNFEDYDLGEVRFAYKQSTEVDYTYTSWVARSDAGSYAETADGLSSDTLYDFKAQLKYDSTEIEGDPEQFNTEKIPPGVTTGAATAITTQSATLHGNLDSLGDYTTINVSFVWGPDPQVDPAAYPYETTPEALTDTGAFSAPLSNLDSDSPYYYRAKATGSVTVYGDEESFTTEKKIPTVTTDAASDITTSNATLNMTYNFEDYDLGEVRFAYKQSTEVDYTYTSWVARSDAGSYAETADGLTSNTLYEFKAQLKYDTTEIEGDVVQFTTEKIPPEVTTNDATDITTSNATLNGYLDSLGDYTTINVSFEWGIESGIYTTNTTPEALTEAGSFSAELIDLNSDTTYYYRTKATGSVTVYGDEVTFTTEKMPPAVTTNPATDVTDMTAILQGNLDSMGDYDTVNVSFEWGTEPEIYTASTTPEALTEAGSFSAELSSLTPTTPYYYRAKAVAGDETIYGGEESFTTYTLPIEVWVDDDWVGLVSGNITPDGHEFGYNAFATIQDGIGGVEDIVGTVYVNDGTYTENVEVNKSVTVQSVNGAGVTTVVSGPSGAVFNLQADYVNITGFTVTPGAIAANGIYLDGANYGNISGCIVTDFSIGIYLLDADNNRLENNVIQGNDHGIIIADSNNNEVLGNNVRDNIVVTNHVLSGIHVYADSSGNVMHFNNIVGNSPYGVYNDNTTENISAHNNWWGDASGPGGVGPGTGDNVTAYVDYDPWLSAEVSNATSATVTDGTLDALAEADIEVIVDGTANVAVAKYAGNPGTGFSGDIDKYVDIYFEDVTNVNEVEIRLYYTDAEIAGKVESSLELYWWDGFNWVTCSDTGVNTNAVKGYSGYIWAKIRDDTTPRLSDLPGTPFGAAGSTSGGGGAISGARGGITEDSRTTSLRAAIGQDGILNVDVVAPSMDNLCRLYLSADTLALNRNGVFLPSITITTIKEPAEPQEYWEIIGYAYELKPAGSTFEPPITLGIEYNASLIPAGVMENDLFIGHWDEDMLEWVETVSTVNTGENLVSTRINHFSIYAVMAKTRPAKFSIADLSVVPDEVDPGEVVTISVTVANTGDLTANYEAVLKINDTVQEIKEITLSGNDSEKVSFTVTPDTGGEYAVDVNGLPGGFTVRVPEGEVAEIPAPEKPAPAPAKPTPPAKEPVTPPPEVVEAPVEEIPEEPTTNWGMWGGIIAAVIVIGGLLTYFLWYRRRTAW